MTGGMATAWSWNRWTRGRTRKPVNPLRLFAAGWLCIALAVAALWWIAGRWTPSRESYPAHGVAVGGQNGEIDWLTLRNDGADFAYIEATAGNGIRDPGFARNWAGARAPGLRHGALHPVSLWRVGRAQ